MRGCALTLLKMKIYKMDQGKIQRIILEEEWECRCCYYFTQDVYMFYCNKIL